MIGQTNRQTEIAQLYTYRYQNGQQQIILFETITNFLIEFIFSLKLLQFKTLAEGNNEDPGYSFLKVSTKLACGFM